MSKLVTRSDAREIMRKARHGFRSSNRRVNFARVHYSLVRLYRRFDPRAIWHAWRAAWHVRKVLKDPLDFNEVYIVSTILSNVWWFLGGNLIKAYEMVESALHYVPVAEPQDEMLPRTRALLYVRSAEIGMKMGLGPRYMMHRYDRALRLDEDILSDPELDHEVRRSDYTTQKSAKFAQSPAS